MSIFQIISLCTGWQRRPLAAILAFLAFGLGLAMVTLCSQFYLDVQSFFNSSVGSTDGYNYLIISKEINTGMTIRPQAAQFSAQDLSDLKNQKFINLIQPIKTNQFQADLFITLGASRFGTELFFEAVPDGFLNKLPPEWNWPVPVDEQLHPDTMPAVPVILPRDFIALYNLGYAPARGLPLVQENLLSIIPMQVRLTGNGHQVILPARIVALTDRIASFLVPDSFMTWANHYFGAAKNPPEQPRRLILKVQDPNAPELESFLRSNSYQAGNERTGLREAAYLIYTLLAVTTIIGILILVLALTVFVLNLQVFLSQSKPDLQLLVLLGYQPERLALLSAASLVLPLALVNGFCLFFTAGALREFHHFLSSRSIDLPSGINSVIFLSAAGIALILPVIQYLTIRANIGFRRQTAT